ncbi:ion transporter [Pedobacter sp. SYSU D00535]|uniref:ion transporter n=1 Tax=Pedobacter sp. SYSU D00535 TaxID=2810308 RepID=UPI001A9714A7|nr:ion transporter [Pedobacter sp. SYSU D00535]
MSQEGGQTARLRRKIYIIIFRSDTRAGKAFDIILLWLILCSIFLVFIESVQGFRETYYREIRFAEWVFTAVFTLEYLLRVYSAKSRRAYVFSFYGLVDLLALVPGYLSLFLQGGQYFVVLRAVRLLRVFRILKLSRYLVEGHVLVTALRNSAYKITVFLSAVIALVTIVGTIMYVVEGENSGFSSIPKSVYWAIVTITTVGYGDISPITPLGQFIASVLMIIGYGIIAVPTGIVSVEMARASASGSTCPNCQKAVDLNTANYCSNCGAKLKAGARADEKK